MKNRVAAILTALAAWLCLCACGIFDYQYAIDDRLSVAECNSQEQDVLLDNRPLTRVNSGGWTGQMEAIGWDDKVVVAQKKDGANNAWFIIDRRTHAPYGPLSDAKFAAVAPQHGADRVRLHDLGTARLYSMASYPWQSNMVENLFQVFVLQGIGWLIIGLPLMVVPGIGVVVQLIRRKPVRRWLLAVPAAWLLPVALYTVSMIAIGFWELFVF